MTKAEAKELIKDFVQYTGKEVDTYREQIIKDYINDSNRTIKFDDDILTKKITFKGNIYDAVDVPDLTDEIEKPPYNLYTTDNE
jgi:hypothetical protein